MKVFASILLLISYVAVQAQRSVQTIVPLQPIAVGAAFQVQYIVTDNEPATALQSPAFGRAFRFVSGPHLYQGEALINNNKTPIQNFSYTLIPLRKGRLVIKGATAVFKSRKVKSNDTFVVVADAANDSLAATPITDLPRLAPGATWDNKLQEQLFIRASVSKQSCFVGEPVVATFTLFSRLPSASEVVKSPGFYGFSVLDMLDAAADAQTVQTYNGAFYNAHILRKVQLYPGQAGSLVVDKMSVNNAIEYTDSASGALARAEVMLESKPLTVNVKPVPATTAETFAGAVGTFAIKSYLEKDAWPQNQNGKLMVTISGAGNFLQLTAPEIQWPRGIDVLEPTATERLQKDMVPASGTRTYTYTFTTDSTGDYTIQPILFTYFDPAEKKFKTKQTGSLHFTVQHGKMKNILSFRKALQRSGSNNYLWAFAALIIAAGWVFFLFKKRRNSPHATAPRREATTPDFEKQLQAISPHESDAYRKLQQALMGFLKSWNQPTAMPQNTLQPVAATLQASQQQLLQTILDECTAVQYYNAAPSVPFSELQQQALLFIKSIKGPQAPERT